MVAVAERDKEEMLVAAVGLFYRVHGQGLQFNRRAQEQGGVLRVKDLFKMSLAVQEEFEELMEARA
jgi:hypothetical protein